MGNSVLPRAVLAGFAAASMILVACTSTHRLDKADAMYESGDLDGALVVYRAVAEADPDNHRAQHSIGIVHYTREEYDEALKAANRAVELRLGGADYRLQRGNVLVRLGRFEDGIRDYEEAIDLDPSLTEAYYAVGIAQYNRHDYAEARRWLKQYLALAPEADNAEQALRLIQILEE